MGTAESGVPGDVLSNDRRVLPGLSMANMRTAWALGAVPSVPAPMVSSARAHFEEVFIRPAWQ